MNPPNTYLIENSELTLITEKGIEITLQHLSEKKSLKITCLVVSSISELGLELEKIKEESSVKRGYIVRHSDNPLQKGSYHMTPVYVEKKDSQIKVLVTDSKGEAGHYHSYIAEKVYEALKLKCLVFKIPRQSDNFRCSAYSIRDLVVISKFDDLFGNLEKTGGIETSGFVDMDYVSILPQVFLDITNVAAAKFDKYVKLIREKTCIHN
jgi:hypothetical protein